MTNISRKCASKIFPDRSEGYYNTAVMLKNIKKNLPEEDYEWSQKFVLSVMNHSDYENIKKILLRLPLDILKKYHVWYQEIIDSPVYSDDFKNICELSILINSYITALAHSIGTVQVTCIANTENLETLNQNLEELKDLGIEIHNENSELIQTSLKKFDELTEKYKEKEYLEKYINMQRSNFHQLIINQYSSAFNSISKKIARAKETSFNVRKWDEQNKYMKKLYHLRNTKGGCSKKGEL